MNTAPVQEATVAILSENTVLMLPLRDNQVKQYGDMLCFSLHVSVHWKEFCPSLKLQNGSVD